MDNSSKIVITITGAAGQIGYSMIPQLASGLVFGINKEIVLNLLDIPSSEENLKGVIMELEDCCYPNLQIGYVGSDAREAFKDSDVIVFLGGFPRKQGMERKELISKNVSIYKEQGQILNEVGKSSCKCLVVANPANTNCMILSNNANKIPKKNFTCLTRLDQNRATSHIARKLGIMNNQLKNIIVWGNHSSTQYPDINYATVKNERIKEIIKEPKDYFHNDFISSIRKRGGEVIAVRKLSSAMSAAKAICDHLRDWCQGTPEGEFTSMGVISDGSKYGIDEGLCFSFPCKTNNFDYEIIDLELDEFSKIKLDVSKIELIEEKNEAYSI